MRYALIYGAPILLLAGVCALGLALLGFPSHASSSSGTPITGYVWSDTIGWISLNCSNDSSCGASNYGLTADLSTGDVSGYAWSPNIGWVSANESGCPAGSCTPNIKKSNGVMTGWLKALSGGSGGWDGWISLSGNSPDYGPVLNSVTQRFSGFAWGSDVVGWVDFQYASSTFPACAPTNVPPICTADHKGLDSGNGCPIAPCAFPDPPYGCDDTVVPNFCKSPSNPSGSFTVSPKIVRAGRTVTVSWNIVGATACTVTGSNGDGVWNGASSPPGGQPSGKIKTQTIYLLHCDGAFPSFTLDMQAIVNIAPVFKEK